MNDLGKSDSPVVPSKPPNNPAAAGAEVVEERGLPEGNAASKTRPGRRAGQGAPNFDRYIRSSHTTCRGGRRMRARLGPGPASMEGLRWLCRVGPAPIDAWACAMGWLPVTRALTRQG